MYDSGLWCDTVQTETDAMYKGCYGRGVYHSASIINTLLISQSAIHSG